MIKNGRSNDREPTEPKLSWLKMKIFNVPRIAIAFFLVVSIVGVFQVTKQSSAPKVNQLVDTLGLCSADDLAAAAFEQPPAILMEDHSAWLGKETRSKTFAIAVADLNNDTRDDILVGAHGQNPYLYINNGNSFSNASTLLFPAGRRIDRHGYTLADLDNDGDLDIAISGGGNDGVGKGSANIILENSTAGNELSFEKIDVLDNFAVPRSRSRSLIPIASHDGSMIDLYLSTLKRVDYPNTLLKNPGRENKFEFVTEPSNPLNVTVDDHGRGTFADFDNDGQDDYLTVIGSQAVLYRSAHPGKGPQKIADLAYSLKAADFNNDGNLDIFIGRFSPPTRSDRISHNDEKLIYVVHKHGEQNNDAVTLKVQSGTLDFDLQQHIKATESGRFKGANDIFLGRDRLNPESRRFIATTEQAVGAPASSDDPGIYIWYDDKTDLWEIRWRFPDFLNLYKGIITAKGISNVTTTGLDTHEPKQVNDYLLINDGNGKFSRHCNIESQHNTKTVATIVADFNNDGWLDIIGARHGEQGAANGEVFVLNNSNGDFFSGTALPMRPRDKLHRADLIAYGFFDGDDKPDAIVTNGYGQIPGTRGATQLLLNRTNTEYAAALVRLQGTKANSFGVGAKLTLRNSAGDILGYRVQGLNANISQDTFWQHFGLGESQGPYTLAVEWPDNSTTRHTIEGAGRHLIKQ